MNYFISLKKQNLIINLLLALFPITYIGGNFFVNANLFLFCIFGLFLIKKVDLQIFKEKKIILIWFFFIYLLIVSFYHDTDNQQIEKSLLFLRYLLFFLITSILLKNEMLNLNFFFLSALILSSLVSLDILFQYNYGYDIFGFEPVASANSKATIYHYPGPFNEEAMAGGYLISFFPIGIFALIIFSDLIKKYFSLIFVSFFSICSTAIMLAGNRMPFIMIIILTFIIIFFIKKVRYHSLVSLIICSIIFGFIYNTNSNFKTYYLSFFDNSIFIAKILKKEIFNTERSKPEYIVANKVVNQASAHKNYNMGSGHIQTYLTSLDIIKDNVIFGQGIRSFRIKCNKFINYETGERQINRVCNTHPHNYYLEIISDSGLIGLLIFLFFIYLIIFKKIKFFFKYSEKNYYNIAFVIIILITLFPFKSSGSFFSTQSATYLFLIMSLLNNERKLSKFN